MFSIISAAIAPGFALLSYFYLKDEYDAEPLKDVFRVFVLGAILVFPIMFIQYVLDVEQVFHSDFFKAFFSSSLLEEFFKWFILYYTIFKYIEFDEHYDGIVYGVAISLGFATLENILYLLSYGLEYAIGRAFLPVSSHALFGVMMGYYMGKAKFSPPNATIRWILMSILLPFCLHGFYDLIILTQRYWFQFIIPFMIFLWWLALRKVKKAKQQSNPYQSNPHTFTQ
ncbi:glutamic-type intramembrane protease PrsW [Caldibacillus lycopersici]|uniref:Protease PrsW n=1 Tax=Perspicuibacillus lycopersici TaxID=1325689 RepID=A0AAE3IUA3_9BACI|nr:glutamic-type intramembrane protease PrsW [Perspicuibacillus lycopersici]MCU9613728.1 glutamic-type intramembrane protease PrsW [Perspicuibacillus lycopersici]